MKIINDLKQYFQHNTRIPLGEEGELSKIQEEFLELQDAHNQKKAYFSIIECADLITTVGMFSWKKYRVPFLFIIIFAYLRKPYKMIRNPFLRMRYGKRKDFI